MKTPKFHKGDILVPSDVPSKREVLLLLSDCTIDSNPFCQQNWYHAKILFREGTPLMRGLQSIVEQRYVRVCNIGDGHTAQHIADKIDKIISVLRAANLAKYGKTYAY